LGEVEVCAKKLDGLDRITRAGVMINFAMTGVLTAILLLFDRAALVLFLGSDSAAVPLAQHMQWLSVWSFMLFGVTMVYSATMRAGGAVMVPRAIIAIALYPVRLGFYFLTYDWLGADAIWTSFPVSSTINFALAALYFWHGGWKKARMSDEPCPDEDEVTEEALATREPGGALNPAV
jgi:Na+-driven multidrug efflux pump